MKADGFTIVELLIAMTITLLLAGALAGLAQPARAAFDRVPAELELQQRGRTALETISQALRASLLVTAGAGAFDELTVIVPIAGGARGVLSIDQADASAALTLGTEHCPNIKDVCGFTSNSTAIIEDEDGFYDVFTIAGTNAAARRITATQPLSRAYPSGSAITEVDQFTFRLSEQPDGTYSLIRETAAGAIQPIVDFVGELGFAVMAGEVDVSLALEPPAGSMRTLIPGRTFHTSIKLRNVP